MKMVSLSEAKAHLSRHVERVRHGESVRIQVRGVPVAELVPISTDSSDQSDDGDLRALERAGLIRRGHGRVPVLIFKPGPPVHGRSVTATLLDERRASR
jgi:prevent-host-death family protein